LLVIVSSYNVVMYAVICSFINDKVKNSNNNALYRNVNCPTECVSSETSTRLHHTLRPALSQLQLLSGFTRVVLFTHNNFICMFDLQIFSIINGRYRWFKWGSMSPILFILHNICSILMFTSMLLRKFIFEPHKYVKIFYCGS
jgi:hypothetical protein